MINPMNVSLRLGRLLEFLELDPDNVTLLADAIAVAQSDRNLTLAEQMIDRLRDLPEQRYNADFHTMVQAIHRREFDLAVTLGRALMSERDLSAVRFNLAWACAQVGDKVEAEALLTEGTVEEVAAAATLRVQLIHERGAIEEAMGAAQRALRIFPDDPSLMAAVSVLALDLEDAELARTMAAGAPLHPDAIASAGMLTLRDGHPADAIIAFDRALAVRSHHPRALLGRGLAKMLEDKIESAAVDLDEGASLFADHIGSWIAAGWAHLLSGQSAIARERFGRALLIDPGFAETQGSLAVIDVIENRDEAARRKIQTAFRLDKRCFSATLALAMLERDDPLRGRALIDQALNAPLDASGFSVATFLGQMIAGRSTVH